MPRPYSIAHLEQLHAVRETTFGTTVTPSSSTFVRLESSFNAARRLTRRDVMDKKPIGSPVDRTTGNAFVDWSLGEMMLRPSGALNTVPELGPFLRALLGAQTTANVSTTVSASPTPTTTTCTVGSASGLAVGDLIRFGTSGEVAQITAIATNALTFTPALTAAPASGEAVTSGTNFKLAANFTETLSIYRDTYVEQEVFAGCWVNQGAIRFAEAGDLRAEFSGSGRGSFGAVGASTLAAGINNSVTALTVPTGEGRKFDVRDGHALWIQINSEVMRVDSVSGDTINVTRAQQSTSAASHNSSDEIVPWTPTPTLVGSELSGIPGFLYVVPADGVRREVKIDSFELQVTNGFEGRRFTRSQFAEGVRRADPYRAIQVNFTLPFDRVVAPLLRDAADRDESVGVVVRVGDTSGRIISAVMRKVRFDQPAPEAGQGGDTMITFTGRAYASARTLDDALVVGNL